MSTAITIQLRSILTSNPKSLKSEIDFPNIVMLLKDKFYGLTPTDILSLVIFEGHLSVLILLFLSSVRAV